MISSKKRVRPKMSCTPNDELHVQTEQARKKQNEIRELYRREDANFDELETSSRLDGELQDITRPEASKEKFETKIGMAMHWVEQSNGLARSLTTQIAQLIEIDDSYAHEVAKRRLLRGACWQVSEL